MRAELGGCPPGSCMLNKSCGKEFLFGLMVLSKQVLDEPHGCEYMSDSKTSQGITPIQDD